jgi:hypothetical protein
MKEVPEEESAVAEEVEGAPEVEELEEEVRPAEGVLYPNSR